MKETVGRIAALGAEDIHGQGSRDGPQVAKMETWKMGEEGTANAGTECTYQQRRSRDDERGTGTSEGRLRGRADWGKGMLGEGGRSGYDHQGVKVGRRNWVTR